MSEAKSGMHDHLIGALAPDVATLIRATVIIASDHLVMITGKGR